MAYPRRIDRRVPAANHDHLLADRNRLAAIHQVQKLRPAEDIRRLFPRNPQPQTLLRPDADKHCLVLLAQLRHGQLAPNHAVALQLHPQVQDALDLRIQHLARQPVARYAVAQHPARLGEGFKHRHRITSPGQLIGARQACRPCSHHCHSLAMRSVAQFRKLQTLADAEVADEALDGVHRHSAVLGRAIAVVLAGMRTHPPAYCREGITLRQPLPHLLERLLVGSPVGFRLRNRGQQLAYLVAVGTMPGARRRLGKVAWTQGADVPAPSRRLDDRLFNLFEHLILNL